MHKQKQVRYTNFMINLTDKERLELLGAVFMDELKVIREYLSDIPIIKQDLRELTAELTIALADGPSRPTATE